jgi:nicotinamidase/pyrazinamidase
MRALLLVDLQNDFMPDGALGVPEGDQVIPVVNDLMKDFELVVATQDWHPPNHKSFASQHEGHEIGEVIEWKGLEQILWPDHCVQNTPGAEFCEGLQTDRFDEVFKKGTDVDLDSYSGFYDNGHQKSTGLGEYLQQRGVDEVHIAGLATDYCVKYSALDARRFNFRTIALLEGCRAVEREPGDRDRAIEEMKSAGVEVR